MSPANGQLWRATKPTETHFGGYGAGVHLFPFRTEKLSPAAPMILQEMCGKVGRRHPHNGSPSTEPGLSCFHRLWKPASRTAVSPRAFSLPRGSFGPRVSVCDIFPSLRMLGKILALFHQFFVQMQYV